MNSAFFYALLMPMLLSMTFVFLQSATDVVAFVPFHRRRTALGRSGLNRLRANNGGGKDITGRSFGWSNQPDDTPFAIVLVVTNNRTVDAVGDACPMLSTQSNDTTTIVPRGGGRLTKDKPNLLTSTTTYWKGVFSTTFKTLTNPFRLAKRQVSHLLKSKATREEEELMDQLQTIKVQSVIVPNSTVLPKDVVQIAAKRSGILGNPLKTEYVQDFAQSIKRWYTLKGYVLHSVTGATLQPETATAEISVQEPVHDRSPVHISVYKEMVLDPVTGNLTTYRQYRDQYERRKTFGWNDKDVLKKDDLNVTYVPSTQRGQVRPSKIAQALDMIPGQPFQWDQLRWDRILQSGLFARVLQVTPRAVGGDAVQLHIVATEAPTKHLEYGIGKSLYSGGWEGEFDFEHMNVLGGGETLGINVRRGTTESMPSIKCKLSTGRLGLVGGYDLEAFSEYIGDAESNRPKADEAIKEDITAGDAEPSPQVPNFDTDVLVDRRGATFRVRNPIDPITIRNSVASASIERTSTKMGLHETIGSTTMEVGPFLRELPFGARSNLDASFTTGARMATPFLALEEVEVAEADDTPTASPLERKRSSVIVPYFTMSTTTRQLFPLHGGRAITSSETAPRRPLLLALKHTLIASTPSVPRHVAKALGTSNQIRGSTLALPLTTALRGTTELRVPLYIPIQRLKALQQDANFVIYSEWLLSMKDRNDAAAADTTSVMTSMIQRKSCIGMGLRKTIQGIPLQYDVTYSNEGKMRSFFGFGRDFVF
jgi:hypothetical protein